MSAVELVSLIDRLRAEANRGVREHMGYEHYVTTPVHGSETRALLRDAAMALAARLPGDEWVMVPREPTPEMCAAAKSATWIGSGYAQTVWKAMIAATPTASPAAGIGEKL